MLDFGGADAKAKCGKSAISSGMAVAAGNDFTGTGQSLFGYDDMLDSLTLIMVIEATDLMALAVINKIFY